jgi:HD-GYP domain-containing protein (c-di-GMP phosphodiesterase class II)
MMADAYDAMTDDRPYRKALSKEEAIERLKKGAKSQKVKRLRLSQSAQE